MNIWKTKDELAKHGRYGDTMMKKIDGDLAHVNPVEYEMSPEYIKEHGAGTINPITGKKEYIPLAAISLGLQGASMLMGGFSAMGNKSDVRAGKAAAYDIYQEQLGLYGEERDLTTSKAETQYTTGVKDLSTVTGTTLQDIETTGDFSKSKTGLVTSTIDQKVKEQTTTAWNKYKTDQQKHMDIKTYTEAEANLQFDTQKVTAEDRWQNTLTQLDAQPTTFWEGIV